MGNRQPGIPSVSPTPPAPLPAQVQQQPFLDKPTQFTPGGGAGRAETPIASEVQPFVRKASERQFLDPTTGAARAATQLETAGQIQKALGTGLPSEAEAGFILSQQLMAQQRPAEEEMLARLQEISGLARAGIPGVQEFQRGQADIMGQLQGSQLGALGAGQGAAQNAISQLAALQGAPGVQQAQQGANIAQQALGSTTMGQLSPEVQAVVDRQRQLAIQRAELAARQGQEAQLSQLQSLMEGRGLGGSSIASRGAADVLGNIQNQIEQGRLAAEQQSLERELGLRGLGLQERGQTIQGALGLTGAALQPAQFQASLAGQQGGLGLQLGQQGLGGIGQATEGLQQFGTPAQLQSALGLLSAPLASEQEFRQNQLQNQLQALATALGAQQTQNRGLGAAGTAAAIVGGLGGLAKGIGALI